MKFLLLSLTLLAVPAAASSFRGLQQECPGTGAPASCTAELDPVICGTGCEYDNACLANLAGFVESQCRPVNEGCPGTGPPGSCTANLDLVKCGTNFACQYDNACLANLAGFGESQCLPVSESCPGTGAPASCTADLNVVKCGTNFACQYDNSCLANLAGYVPSQCLPLDAEIPPPCNTATDSDCTPTTPPTNGLPPCNTATDTNCEPTPFNTANGTPEPMMSSGETVADDSSAMTNLLTGSLVLAGASMMLAL